MADILLDTLRQVLDEKVDDALTSMGAYTIYVINTLDQSVSVQIKGNRVQSTSNSSSISTAFSVSANSADFRTLVASQSGILPWIYVELSCASAPSTGSVTVYLIKGRDEEETLVNALEIRDTSAHNPSTNPDKMFILRWW